MPYETPLTEFKLLQPISGNIIALEQQRSDGFRYELSVISGQMVRVKLGLKQDLQTIDGALKPDAELASLSLESLGLTHDENKRVISFGFEDSGVSVKLEYALTPYLTILDKLGRVIHRDLRTKRAAFSARGPVEEVNMRTKYPELSWYSQINTFELALGLGEKCAPLNLMKRRLELGGVSFLSMVTTSRSWCLQTNAVCWCRPRMN